MVVDTWSRLLGTDVEVRALTDKPLVAIPANATIGQLRLCSCADQCAGAGVASSR